MRAALAALVFIAASSAQAQPVPWNPAAPENRVVLSSFNYGTVESVLTSIGARFQRSGDAARPALAATFPNGRQAGLLFGNCERQGAACKALSIQSVWARPANVTPERLAFAIQQFNQRYAFSRAYVTADGRPALQRYLTADFGIIRGNLAVNLLVFANQADRFNGEVLRPLATSAR